MTYQIVKDSEVVRVAQNRALAEMLRLEIASRNPKTVVSIRVTNNA